MSFVPCPWNDRGEDGDRLYHPNPIRWTRSAVTFAVAHPVRARRFVRAARAPWPELPA